MAAKFDDRMRRLSSARTIIIAWAPRCLRTAILLSVGWEMFFVFEHGWDTCNWVLSSGYLVPWSHSGQLVAADGQSESTRELALLGTWNIRHKWENGRCSNAVYLPQQARQCFKILSSKEGSKFKVGFVGDHWIKDLYTTLVQYVNDSSSKAYVKPPFSARHEGDHVDILLRWLPYMDNPRPFGVGIGMNLTNWNPNVVVGGAGLWTLLQRAPSDPTKFRDYQDNVRIFGENAAAHLERTTIWKLNPLYHRNAKYEYSPDNMDYQSTNKALLYYNQAAQNALKEVPDQKVRIWSADDVLVDSLTYYNQTSFLDWKHFSNETLFYQMQMLLNVVCNRVTQTGLCCSKMAFTSYFLTNPTWLSFYVLCMCQYFHFHLLLLRHVHRVLRGVRGSK